MTKDRQRETDAGGAASLPTTGTRLLLVVPSASSFRVFLSEVAEAWVRGGGAVAVATAGELPGTSGAEWPSGVERLELPEIRGAGVAAVWRASRALRRIVRDWRPEIVHAHFGAAAVIAALARGNGFGARWWATFHGMHATAEGRTSSGLVGRVETWSAGRMDGVCVLNREDSAFLAARLPAGRVHLQRSVGVGCRLDRFDPLRFGAAERGTIRRELGLPDTGPVLVFVGRQVAFKGFATVIRAFRLLAAGRPDARLLLVGTADPLHFTGLDAQETALLAGDARIVSAGWQSDVARCLAVADLCVFPSMREGMPVNLMEALAMGVPVIAAEARGCRDVVRHGIDGLVLAERTPVAWARTCAALLDDQARREAMSVAALAGRGRFDRSLYCAEQIGMYRSVARGAEATK